MITPMSFGAIFETIDFRRLRSRSLSLRAHAGHAAGWHEHKEAPGERHLARQSCALVPDRSFVTCTSTGSPDLNASSILRG